MQRMVRGLLQTELGKAVGVSFQQMHKYEKGANRISAQKHFERARVVQPEGHMPRFLQSVGGCDPAKFAIQSRVAM